MIGANGIGKDIVELRTDLRLVGFPPILAETGTKHFRDPFAAVSGVQVVVAPVANTDLDSKIFTRLDDLEPIDLTVILPTLAPDTVVLIGVAKPVIARLVAEHGLRLVETADIDECNLKFHTDGRRSNPAWYEELPITIHGSRCLVVGFGRCKRLQELAALGAKVTAVDRNKARLWGSRDRFAPGFAF